MSKKYVIGIDVGGTKILTAIADLEGKILARERIASRPKDTIAEQVDQIVETVEQVMKSAGAEKDEILRIAVGAPGTVNTYEGVVLFTPNLRWENVPITKLLQDKLNIEVILENDANAAALAEHLFGAGKDAKHMVYLTISTGIGGGVIINNQILHGTAGCGGEIGHHTILLDGPICGCGNQGCLETLASGTALGRYGREAVENGLKTLMKDLVNEIDEIDGTVVTKAAKAGDKIALDIVNRVAEYIGIGIANMINIFNPEKVILGGGVTSAGDLFYDGIVKTVEARALSTPRKLCKIVFSELKSDVGVLGAIAVALQGNKDK